MEARRISSTEFGTFTKSLLQKSWPSTLHQVFTRRNTERVSVMLLLAGVVYWMVSAYRMELIGIAHTWFPVPFMGIDFEVGTYLPAQAWLRGENPYQQTYKNVALIYPPFALRAFIWTWLAPFQQAYFLMLLLLGSCVAWATWYGVRIRKETVDNSIGPATAIFAVLFSTPVLFAMERGNYDLLVLPCLVVGMILLRRQTTTAEILAGVVLAFAPWLKVYPALIGLALLATKRWRAFGAFVMTGLFIGIMDLPYVISWAKLNAEFSTNSLRLSAMAQDSSINYWWHSLTASWSQLLVYCPPPIRWLRAIPGGVAALAILIPPALWVCWRFSKSRNSVQLVYPLMLWLTALASFLPPIANDYSLFFLPMAAIFLWKRQDSWAIHLCLLLMLFWWQPVALPINGRVLMMFKLIGLFATGVMLIRRLDELDSKHQVSLAS